MVEPRRSSVRLAAALVEAGLEDMAPRARAGHWHAYDAEEPQPRRRLVLELRARAHRTHRRVERDRIKALADAVRRGEYDAPLSESVKRRAEPSLRDRAAKSGLVIP